MENKDLLLKTLTPLSILKALTKETKSAILRNCLPKDDIIGIWHYPFRVGRESRIKYENGIFTVYEREKKPNEQPNNDLYLIDHEAFLHISREHFQIEKKESTYFITDRESTCGTMVNDVILSAKTEYYTHPLHDGDIVTIGSKDSPYKFQFIVL